MGPDRGCQPPSRVGPEPRCPAEKPGPSSISRFLDLAFPGWRFLRTKLRGGWRSSRSLPREAARPPKAAPRGENAGGCTGKGGPMTRRVATRPCRTDPSSSPWLNFAQKFRIGPRSHAAALSVSHLRSGYCWRIRLDRREPEGIPSQEPPILSMLRPADHLREFANSIGPLNETRWSQFFRWPGRNGRRGPIVAFMLHRRKTGARRLCPGHPPARKTIKEKTTMANTTAETKTEEGSSVLKCKLARGLKALFDPACT